MGLSQPNAPSPPETTLAVVTKGKTVRPDKETKARDRLGEAIKRRAPLAEIRRLCADVVAWAVRSYAIDGAQLAPALREVCEQISLAIDEETGGASATGTSFEQFCRDALTHSEENTPREPDRRALISAGALSESQAADAMPPEAPLKSAPMGIEKRAVARQLAEAGYPVAEVARRLEMHPGALRKWYAAWGFSRPSGRPSSKPAPVAQPPEITHPSLES